MSSLRFPIDGAFRIGYGFGYRGDIGVPGASEYHEGIDIIRPDGPLPVGTPIHAILDGKVLISTTSGGAGSTTLTEHAYQGGIIRVRSNHFSRRLVRAGQRITQGQVLGESGGMPGTPGAGSSGGPHYHCGVYKIVNGRAVAIDPGPFFGLGSTRGIGTIRPGKNFPALAGGDSKPFIPEEAIMANATIIIERADSQKAKGVFDPEKGKIVRELNGPAESSVWRGVEAKQDVTDLQVVFVRVSDSHYDSLR